MSTYTRPIDASLLASGLVGTLGYTVKATDGTTLVARTTSGITEDGTTANYFASVASWDTAWRGRIIWDDGTKTLARETFLDGVLTGDVLDQSQAATLIAATPVKLDATQPNYAPSKAGDTMKVDLTQGLTDVATPTVGGALNGMHATAWGKIAIVAGSGAAGILKLFSFGSSSTPKATFDLDVADNPKSRTPL